jgi:Ca2+-binding RTX toxin-like protein
LIGVIGIPDDGRNIIIGGDGDDSIHGGSGDDLIFGGRAKYDFGQTTSELPDYFFRLNPGQEVPQFSLDQNAWKVVEPGRCGKDDIQDIRGRNWIYGQNGNDMIAGGIDGDTLFGGEGNDLVFGKGGRDRLRGDAGIDTLDGGEGPDHIGGGRHRDVIHGGPGADTISGGSGDDEIYGNTPDDDSDEGDRIFVGSGLNSIDGEFDNGESELEPLGISEQIAALQGYRVFEAENGTYTSGYRNASDSFSPGIQFSGCGYVELRDSESSIE